MWEALKRRPAVAWPASIAVAIGGAVSFLAGLANIWNAMSQETVPQFLANQEWAVALPRWQGAAVLTIGLAVLVFQTAILREAFRHGDGGSQIAKSPKRDRPQESSTLAGLQAHEEGGTFFTSPEWERQFARQLLDETLPLTVQLTLAKNVGSGCTPGLWVKATNRDPVTVEGAVVIVTDIKRWDELLHTFVTSPDVHGSGTTLTEMPIGKATLHPNIPEDVGFIRYEANRLELTDEQQNHVRMTAGGIRQIAYRVEGAGRRVTGTICFRWEGPQALGQWPEPCDCPQL